MPGQTFNVTANGQTIYGQEANDTLNDTSFSNDTLDVYSGGNSFATVNIGTGQNNTVFAYMSDVITAGNGTNNFYSGSYSANTESGGNNTYNVGNGNNNFGLSNNDIVTAGDGSNNFSVYGTGSTITAGNGNNTITYIGSNVSSTVDLGNGNNTINYNGSAGIFNVQVGTGSDQIFIGRTNSSTVDFTFTQAAGAAPSDIDLSHTAIETINITVTNPGDIIPTDNLTTTSFTLNVATDGYKIPYAATTVNYVATNEAIAAPYNLAQPLPYFISDLLFYPAPRWTAGIGVQATPVTLTFSFMQSLPSYASTTDATGFTTMGPDLLAGYSPQQLLTMNTNHTITLNTVELASVTALANWAAVVNINFISATDSNSVQIRFGENNQGTSSSAYSYDPLVPVSPYYTASSYQESGDIYVNTHYITNSYFNTGNFGASALAHEIGHTIGMGGESGASDPHDVFPAGLTDEDSTLYTVMSYNDVYPYPNGPQVFDTAVAQYLYGPNPSYTSPSNSGTPHVWTFSASGGIDNLIMDGTGLPDTITAAGTTQAAFIDLRQGHFSYLGASQAPSVMAANQLWVGFGTVVNTAAAGAGTTTIVCNDGADTVTCGSGLDLVVVGGGNDTINGGSGQTTIEFADPLADYKLSKVGNQLTVTEIVTPARGTMQGTDILTNVQTLEFSNETIAAQSIVSTVDTFATLENAAGRGANGIPLMVSGSAGSATTDGVVGFQNMAFAGGNDAVVLDGPRSQYTIAVSNTGATQITDTADGQTVNVTGVGESYLIFNSGSAASQTSNGAPLYDQIYFVLTPTNAQIAEIYAAALDRQPDLAGLEYWEHQVAAGLSLNDLAYQFVNSPEFASLFPAAAAPADHGGSNDTAFVVQIYEFVLGRAPDVAGEAYWLGQLASGAVNRSEMLADFAISTENKLNIEAVAAGKGWLIDPNGSGGYADSTVALPVLTVLNQAASSHFINANLIDTGTLVTTTVSDVTVSSADAITDSNKGDTIVLSTTIHTATVSGGGGTIVGPTTGGALIIDTGGSTNIHLSGTGNVINYGPGDTITGYQAGADHLSSATTVPVLYAPTASAVLQGSSLTGTNNLVYIGSAAGDTAAAIAIAANAVFMPADVAGETVLFYAQTGTDTSFYKWVNPATPTTTVTAGELTAELTLVGVTATSLKVVDFHS